MKKLLFILTLVISITKCVAQNTSNDSLAVVVTFCDQMPEFEGGSEMMYKFIKKNLIYPEDARKNEIEGRVILQFIVERDGSLSHIEVMKPLAYGCTEEAIRLVNSMPKWKPGRQEGQLVRVKYVLPIIFKL